MASVPPPPTLAAPDRLAGIQALRGIAALLVVFVHYATAAVAGGFGWAWLGRVELGHGGVDVFFVVSGFIMEHTAGGGTDRLAFLRRRAARILPLYWTLTIVAYALIVFAPGFLRRAAGPEHFVLSMLLLPGLSPNGNGWYVIGMAWSLTYELWFYLVFALLMPYSRVVRLAGLAAIFAAAVALGLALDPASPIARVPGDALAFEFLAGVLLAMAHRAGRRWSPPLAGAIALVSIAALLARHDAYAGEGFPRLALWGVPAIGLVYSVVLGQWRAGGVLSHALARLGDISYSLYLSHFFAIAAFSHLYARWLPSLAPAVAVLACLALCLVTAEICYRLVEAPARRRFNRADTARYERLVSAS